MQWNARLYDNSHQFVSRYGEDVVELLEAGVGEQILDLGCGTGDLAERISLGGCSVTGVDASPRMIAAAREKYPHLHFVCADAARLDLPGRFDAVFSNAALHWMTEPDQVLERVAAHLKQGGRFVAEMGARGNVQKIMGAIVKALKSHGYDGRAQLENWYFPSPAEYATKLESHGLGIRFMACFDRPTPLSTGGGMAEWLNMFAGNYFAGMEAEEKGRLLDEIVEELAGELYRDGSWVADYRRLRFQAVLEG